MMMMMMMGASSLASSCVWERMVVYKGTCMTTMVWAAECYFQDLEMIGFYFICFWEQGGFLIHDLNHSLIGPFFWMAKVAVHTNTPAPYYGHYVHSLAPLSQGIMPLNQLQGRPLRLLSSISVVPLCREHRRYFYVNDRTSASQWDFPTEEDKEEDLKGNQSSSQGYSKTSSASAGGPTGQ